MPRIPVSTKCRQQTVDLIQNIDCRLQSGYKMQTKNLKNFYVWYIITCHLTAYRASRNRFPRSAFTIICTIVENSWPISWWKSIVIQFQAFNIVFLLCARVGWCDVCTDFTNVIKVDDANNSLKRQKSPETTTDTQGMRKFYWFLRENCSYFEVFIVVNRPYFVPYTISSNVLKFSTVPLLS